MLHASLRGFDACFVVDPGNAPFVLPLALRGIPTLFHTDGLGWQRRKWSPLQRKYYRWSEKVCARVATWLVTDSRAMQVYYEREYRAPSSFIPYSGEVGDSPTLQALESFGVQPGEYFLAVARMEPENNLDLIVREYRQAKTDRPLIVVGSTPYPTEYSQALMAQASDKVRMVGGVFDSAALNSLYRYCRGYFHGHEVGGTNPSLLRAMHWGAPCIPIDVVFHREVLGDINPYFTPESGDLAALIEKLDRDSALRERLGRSAERRAETAYRWDAVADGYATILQQLVQVRSRNQAKVALEGREVYRPELFVESEAAQVAAQ
jgi:glycosyltransferase involved in cell wall biosynthesis